jgi:hypothetical protein
VAFGLLGLHPWEFRRYTVREFEEAVLGAHQRHAHLVDVVMRHALATGQWSRRVRFRDLTGRDAPLPLDPRLEEDIEAERNDDDRDRIARARAAIAAATRAAAAAGAGAPPDGDAATHDDGR